MALIPIRVDRTSKPPIGTPLRSDGHWSVQGLVGVLPLNEGGGSPIFYTRVSSATPAVWNADKLKFNGTTTYYDYTTPPVVAPPFTVITRAKSALDSGRTVLSIGNVIGDDFNYYQIGFGTSEARVVSREGAAGYNSATLSLSDASIFHTIAGIYSTTSLRRICVNGDSWGQDTVYVPTPEAQMLSITIGALARPARGDYFDGTIDYCLLYSRALTDVEVVSISYNPWQIYEPETIWINVGAASSLNQYSFRFQKARPLLPGPKMPTSICQPVIPFDFGI
jgi:hypothetical protein